MKNLVVPLLLLILSSCGVRHRFPGTASALKDTSIVYALPYPKGVAHFVIQGYKSRFSHKGRLNIDFLMKKGSDVTAARGGVVVKVEERYTEGGINKKYFRFANQVIVRHSDGSLAMYAHLQKNGALAAVGDTVKQGQLIAKSGSTGYSALPHLHFAVWLPSGGRRAELPTRFHTGRGIKYLRPGRWYRAQ
ncbi:MAG TPA: M23 family metallopeptidase [Flavisolibacter sp.]|jgi:murein DD-endopeptidase MepM/ murein hydrolase activator NlpD